MNNLNPVATYALRLGDNGLVLAQRLGAWCGHAPELEIDLALANIGLDLLGQARNFLSYAAELAGSGDEDTLAYGRDERQYGNLLLVEQPNGNFADTIARNIGVVDEQPDMERVRRAARMANIDEWIESLPMRYDTKIGLDGHGLSTGQRQRLFIARAAYKDAKYLFLDEATNSLDAANERSIMEKLQSFFEGRTVVVVAHRLSTVMNADNIVVLDRGRIVEQGTHKELTARRGHYYNLVRNQLELGN